MEVSLSSAWNPRGEISRFERILEHLRSTYSGLAISFPPDISSNDRRRLNTLLGEGLVLTNDWSHGRHAALEKALSFPCSHVHYVDADRLIRWVETRGDEWRRTVAAVTQSECLVIGRTESAWDTHPQSLRQTERITNTFFSFLLGQKVDLSAGSKGFSRESAALILENSPPGRALGTDAEWIVLLHRAGVSIDSVLVDGLDWEIADQHLDRAANLEQQRRAALEYDSDPKNWLSRVQVAGEIMEAGLEAMQKTIET